MELDRAVSEFVVPAPFAHHRRQGGASLGQVYHHEHRMLGDCDRVRGSGDH